MSLYSFRQGPAYRGATSIDLFDAALDQPMNLGATFWDQAKGGIVESFGLGTALRHTAIPEGVVNDDQRRRQNIILPFVNPLLQAYEVGRRAIQGQINQDQTPLSQDAYQQSPYFRKEVPWDEAMTEDRAAALATWYDTQRVREYFASKRPITSFLGNLAGQAVDPINYVPIAGQSVRAANIARFGFVRGSAATAAIDAAANTAAFGIATREARESFGDDVSWQRLVTEIATAALIGGAFGTGFGLLGRRGFEAQQREIEARLSTLRNTQEARIALNEAVGGLINDGEVRLSPNATDPLARIMRENNPARSPDLFAPLDREDLFGSTAVGRVIDNRPATVREFEAAVREDVLATSPELAQRYRAAEEKFTAAQEKVAEIEEGLTARRESDAVALVDEASAERLRAIEDELAAGPAARRREVLEAERDLIVESLDADAVARVDRETRIGPEKQAKRARTALAAAREDFARVRREVDALASGLEKVRSLRSRAAVDTTPARPETLPEGRAQAEQAIARPDDFKAMAAQYRVDPETGAYFEEPEIEQLRTEGRLTEDDEAALADATTTYENGDAWGKALKAAVSCLI
ncbi:hypothetical protein [Chelativorans xinjiangense]|uniref:hypothetical protein n=1 Tax=Chelativorans xinjiangense TaxID=2681485 RepID=UPI00135B072E|nr:hypothetical protein [Chelativorans xinjiangense]